ncbi:MAG: hypothetical protein MUO77_15855, partial [Anaerolineales bacterium]|nr:hypothetical protein [Anaerolineales bacterium]
MTKEYIAARTVVDVHFCQHGRQSWTFKIIGETKYNKLAKSSKFLSPQQADGVLRNFAPSGQVLLKRGTHVASHGVFSLNKGQETTCREKKDRCGGSLHGWDYKTTSLTSLETRLIVLRDWLSCKEDLQASVSGKLFSSTASCHIKYHSGHKHQGSDDILDRYIPSQQVH